MGKLTITIGFYLVCWHVHGQLTTESSLNRFLKSALDDPYYVSFSKQESVFNKPGSYALPWVQKLEFRTRNNELLDFRQQYALRLDPGNPWQIRSNQRYFKGFQAIKSIEQQLVLKDLLRERYDLVVDYWFASTKVRLLAKQKEIREQIRYVMTQRSGSSGFDADQYLNNELDIISKTADWHEAEFDLTMAKTRIGQLYGATPFVLEENTFITIQQINEVIKSPNKSTSATEADLLKQSIANTEQKIKTDKLNFDLGFIQAMYSPFRVDQNRNPYGISLGVAVPLFNQNRDDVVREKLKVIEQQGELEQFQQRESGKSLVKAATLQLHLAHHQQIDSLINAVKSREMNLATTLADNYNPVIELKYQEKLIQLDLLRVRIAREILLQYISLLESNGILHQRPLRNYLSSGLITLE